MDFPSQHKDFQCDGALNALAKAAKSYREKTGFKSVILMATEDQEGDGKILVRVSGQRPSPFEWGFVNQKKVKDVLYELLRSTV